MTGGDQTPLLPEEFRNRFRAQFGAEELHLFERTISHPAPTSIRINPQKVSLRTDRPLEQITWNPHGIYLKERPIFGLDPLWHAGCYYVQEASSMFVANYIDQIQKKTSIVIDLCAAPGGKSTLLRSLLPKDTLLIANEPDRSRVKILQENIVRYDPTETIITNAFPYQLQETGIKADMILVDAPCSGEGMFRKDHQSIKEWSLANITQCVARQREILSNAWQMLNHGGVLVYSTCTYNREENEDQLKFLMKTYNLEIIHPHLSSVEQQGITRGDIEGVYRFFPHKLKGEGYTVFAVRKKEECQEVHKIKKGRKTIKKKREKSPLIDQLSSLFEISQVLIKESYAYRMSSLCQSIYHLLNDHHIPIISAGIGLAELKGKDLIPMQPWAMAPSTYSKAPFPAVELTQEQVHQYLRREAIEIPSYKGIQSVTYKGIPIGWVKNIGSRANNLYPKSMVIQSKIYNLDSLNEIEEIIPITIYTHKTI